MSISKRRHNTDKIIKKRLKTSRECFGGGGIEQERPHMLHKWNFTCSCSTCKAVDKRENASHRSKQNRDIIEENIEEYDHYLTNPNGNSL